MYNSVKNKAMTNSQLTILAYQTCQWWNAVFVQAKRFLDVLSSDHGGYPWDEDETCSMFLAERMFLIVAIFHALEDLQKLDVEMQRNNDYTFKSVLEAIEAVAPLDDIKNLRDMNEHKLDYMVDMGKKQDKFHMSVKNGDHEVLTTPAWTVVNGDAQLFLLGNVQIDKLLIVMKEQSALVRTKTEEVFNKALLGK